MLPLRLLSLLLLQTLLLQKLRMVPAQKLLPDDTITPSRDRLQFALLLHHSRVSLLRLPLLLLLRLLLLVLLQMLQFCTQLLQLLLFLLSGILVGHIYKLLLLLLTLL